ncbi:proteobacterial dedicated sortase system histidine kinase [Veronia pacifica]|uniref:histidine kinase n=1 Tax=Veronia pacifica TaxID=1080227 RepID=A0A1C3EG72_9GAMM|nr:proteobacterial dedicated sortase system histidine kinase [Veronia pacifica]ODA32247.1 proteobacterial dedicated sortase system histidine kinase [Veronia pacifica]
MTEFHKLRTTAWRWFAGIRTKVILLSTLLLLLPVIGYNYVWELEKVLRQGQEQTLMGSARSLAMLLNQQPALLKKQAETKPHLEQGKDLYAINLDEPLEFNGQLKEWTPYKNESYHYDERHVRFSKGLYRPSDIHIDALTATFEQRIYLLFDVTDKSPILRRPNASDVTRNDHLVIALTTRDGEFCQYHVSASKDGPAQIYLISPNDSTDDVHYFASNTFQANWQVTEHGHFIEVSMPAWLVGEKLGFEFFNVNDKFNREVETIIGSASINSADKLGTFLIPSQDVEKVIDQMGGNGTRFWVVDRHGRAIAKTGDIKKGNGVWETSIKYQEPPAGLSGWLSFDWLRPLYYYILERPPEDFVDSMQHAAIYRGVEVQQALLGRPYANWRTSDDQKAMILSAAYPVKLNDTVVAAVVAEETTNGVRTLRNKALEQLFTVLLAVIITGVVVMLLFGSHISKRVRRLRDEADAAIDTQGRVLSPISPTHSRDEIGDLSRTITGMLNRLSAYHSYLEKMPSSLSHEMRTPVAVVRSSLENLAIVSQDPDQHRYIERAQEGVARLALILSNMTEATRLEQSFAHADKANFPINEVINGCVQGYQMAYAPHPIQLDLPSQSFQVNGVPEYIAQLLDKLVANAIEFSLPDKAVNVSLRQYGQSVLLSVSNKGPLLAPNMGEQLVNSMVSVRSESQKSDKPHLGLGLYIARLIAEFHQGGLTINNLPDQSGVVVTVSLPVLSSRVGFNLDKAQ